LVIGVGGYRHLEGGEEPGEQNLGLGQLTSPALSARAIADWLLEEFNNPDAPLGTLELLISPPPKPKRGRRAPRGVERARRAARDVEPATMANVEAAFRRWFNRCNADEGNVALFFFCGHGVRKTNLFLLLEDFGADPLQLFHNAIDFEGVHRGLASQCRARVQCLFADACRQVAPEVLELIDPRGESFLDGRHDVFFPEDAPLFYSTMPTQSAYGLSDEPTLYTQALLCALRGGAGRKVGDRWVVTTSYLQGGILAAMDRISRQQGIEDQEPTSGGHLSGGSVINVLPQEPLVAVKVSLRPLPAAERAVLSLTSVADPGRRQVRRKRKGDWEVTLRAEFHNGRAHFPKEEYEDGAWLVMPYPPLTEELWAVKEKVR
jgi:hypothetical protein